MSTRNARAVLPAWLIATILATGLASAQTATGVEPAEVRRPFRGLFGGPGNAGDKQALAFTGSVFGAYDDDVFADQGAVAQSPDVRRSGWFEGIEAGLVYTRQQGRRIGFGADVGVGVTRYPGEPISGVYRAAVNLGLRLRRNTSLSAAESFVYAPDYRLGLFVSPTGAGGAFEDPFAGVAADLGLLRERSLRTVTNVTLTHTMRDRSSVSGYYTLGSAAYVSESLNYVTQGAGTLFRRQLTRNAGLRLGYSYGAGRYPNQPGLKRPGIHNIDAGVDYGRALSISRRTRFSFSTGSALFYANQGATIDSNPALRFAFLGSANLNHEMGRTWTAAAAYRRSLDFHEGFAEPFLAHSASTDLQGLLTRRLQFLASASYSRGVVGAGSNNNFGSSGATVGLQHALSKYLAAYVNYLYYRYRFPDGIAIDSRLPRGLARNGARIGLSTSIPLIRAR